MSGLDKILEDIQAEAEAQAKDILDKAADEAARIRREAEAETEKECASISRSADERGKELASRSSSAAALKIRQRKLAVKQELISEVFEETLRRAEQLPDREYFDMILKMAAKAAHPGQGTIIFGEKDLKRLPADFKASLSEALGQDTKLVISPKPGKIDCGFLLSYDGIEENCTFRAVLSSREEEIQDKIRQIIFQ